MNKDRNFINHSLYFNVMVNKEKALDYHVGERPGKIEIKPTKPHLTQDDISLAYSPGVAYPSLEIEADRFKSYKYTLKGNLVGVISNGTSVLGLGNIGALASKPVMEGKAMLFKVFAGVDAFDIEVDEQEPYKFIEAVRAIAPTFGAINLEDIKAPDCFVIEKELKKKLDIPVMHDDQHGTAVVVLAALINALELIGRDMDEIKIVFNGAGAASIATAHLLCDRGLRRENLVMVDSKGVIRKDRPGLDEYKSPFATDRKISTLEEAMRGADVLIGLSRAGQVTAEMVDNMADKPVIFALANPVPEITPEEIAKSGKKVIYATGRSDYPNQVNNALAFPYIFKGALESFAYEINRAMLIAAAEALASVAHEPVGESVLKGYKISHLSFGPDYILPKICDPRLRTVVTAAVVKAARDSGVAREGL